MERHVRVPRKVQSQDLLFGKNNVIKLSMWQKKSMSIFDFTLTSRLDMWVVLFVQQLSARAALGSA